MVISRTPTSVPPHITTLFLLHTFPRSRLTIIRETLHNHTYHINCSICLQCLPQPFAPLHLIMQFIQISKCKYTYSSFRRTSVSITYFSACTCSTHHTSSFCPEPTLLLSHSPFLASRNLPLLLQIPILSCSAVSCKFNLPGILSGLIPLKFLNSLLSYMSSYMGTTHSTGRSTGNFNSLTHAHSPPLACNL